MEIDKWPFRYLSYLTIFNKCRNPRCTNRFQLQETRDPKVIITTVQLFSRQKPRLDVKSPTPLFPTVARQDSTLLIKLADRLAKFELMCTKQFELVKDQFNHIRSEQRILFGQCHGNTDDIAMLKEELNQELLHIRCDIQTSEKALRFEHLAAARPVHRERPYIGILTISKSSNPRFPTAYSNMALIPTRRSWNKYCLQSALWRQMATNWSRQSMVPTIPRQQLWLNSCPTRCPARLAQGCTVSAYLPVNSMYTNLYTWSTEHVFIQYTQL